MIKQRNTLLDLSMFLLGKKISPKKSVSIALTQIPGIGRSSAKCLCRMIGINEKAPANQLSKPQITTITRRVKENALVKGELYKIKRERINRLIRNKSYRGMRHRANLPVRGQRTSSNGKTQKRLGNKKRKGR